MKRFSQKTYLFLGMFIAILVLNACKNDDATETENVNRFINDCFEVHYLWNDKLPNIKTNAKTDPFSFFDNMKYEEDRWSTLTNDVQAMQESFSGEETTFGYSLAFAHSASIGYWAIIQYVYPNSPAKNAGLKRGDIIMKVNGNSITQSNYLDLYYASSLSLDMGEYKNGLPEQNGETVRMTATKTYMNPIIAHKIIEKGTHKIAYLHYSDYLLKSHDDLEAVFAEFEAAAVNDFVLDLRYNGGGYSITSQFLCSMLLPQNKLNKKNVYLQEVWNDDYMNYFTSKDQNGNKYFTNPITYKNENGKNVSLPINVNLNMQRIYILTGSGTASASEATIVGLKPYMSNGVVLIGETTHGKFCGGSIFTPEMVYDTSGNGNKWIKSIKNWGAYLMLYRYANANGEPKQTLGLAPDYLVEDNITHYSYALGDENEPLLAKAIELITGMPQTNASLKTTPIQTHRQANELKIPPKALDGKMISNKPYLHQND